MHVLKRLEALERTGELAPGDAEPLVVAVRRLIESVTR
jgi:hypothetical protein